MTKIGWLQSCWRTACCAAVLALFIPAYAAATSPLENGGGKLRQSVLSDVHDGEVVALTPGLVEGIGLGSGRRNIDVSAHGWQRLIDSHSSDKIFIPFATASELQQFVASGKANEFYFDFFRPADTLSVDYALGVSDASLIDTAPAQVLVRNVNLPGGRLDSRTDAAFDASRELRFSNVTLNMEREDCRKPQALGGGVRNDLPATICRRHNWTETPSLILTYRPIIRNNGTNREDPARQEVATFARDYSSYIAGRNWDIDWDTPVGVVPPVSAPPIGESCPPTGHNQHRWLGLSTNNSQFLVGAPAQAAPNNCGWGVQSARRIWDVEQDAICFDSQYYRQNATREMNVRWADVTCAPRPDCGAGKAVAPNGNCVAVSAGKTTNMPQNAHFYSFNVGQYPGQVRTLEGSALRACAMSGLSVLHDFSGSYGGKKKPGKDCGDADSPHANYQFNGDMNSSSSVLNLANYVVNWSKGKDSNCLGWMKSALCSGPNYVVPTLQMVAQNVTDPAQATPPAGMAECPADLNLASGNAVFSNTNYFVTTTQGVTADGSHQLRTANSFDAGRYPVTVLAKQGFNCYQRTSTVAPQYDYNAPPEQWTVTQQCFDLGEWGGWYCFDTSTPPVVGNTTYYTLYTLTTALHCGAEQVTAATGRRVANCNNTGRDGDEYMTYTTSVGGQCGVDGPASYSCVADPEPSPCDSNPWLCGGGWDNGGCNLYQCNIW